MVSALPGTMPLSNHGRKHHLFQRPNLPGGIVIWAAPMGVDEVKAGFRILGFLIPPINGDSAKRFRYDATVSLTLFLGGAFVAFNTLWLYGALGFIGLTVPFATAADVRQARDQANLQQMVLGSIRVDQINDKIRDANTRVCLAIRASDQSALDAWARELETQKQRYRDAMGREPSVWGCDELLVGGTKP